MVFILKESEAAKSVFRYKNIAAYSLKKSKKGFSNDKLNISYEKNMVQPDEDVINGVIKGDMKASKVIKKAIKELRNPANAEDRKALIATIMTINILTNNSKRPNVLVFVREDSIESPEERAREKFLVKYIKAICEEFGIVPITKMDKKIKKLFKGKKKNISRNIEKWLRSGKSGKYGPSRTTVRYCRKLITYFAIELHQIGLSVKDPDDIGGKECRDLARTLANVFTNDNLKKICETSSKKEAKKLCKKLRKKNKVAYNVYEETRKILNDIYEGEFKLPKAKFGYTTKKKKGKKVERPKMDPNIFVKKLSKGKMANIIQFIYMNIAYVQISGDAFGSPDWAKGIQKNLVNSFGKDLATTFIDKAKANHPKT